MASSTTARLRFNNLLQTDTQAHPSKSILPFTHPSFHIFYSLIHPCIHPSVYSSIQGYASFHSSIFHIIYLLIHLCIHPLLIHPNLFFNPHIHLSFIHSSTQTHPLIDSSTYSSFHYSCFQTLKLPFIQPLNLSFINDFTQLTDVKTIL